MPPEPETVKKAPEDFLVAPEEGEFEVENVAVPLCLKGDEKNDDFPASFVGGTAVGGEEEEDDWPGVVKEAAVILCRGGAEVGTSITEEGLAGSEVFLGGRGGRSSMFASSWDT